MFYSEKICLKLNMKKNDISYVVARSKHVKINIQKTIEVSKNLKIINNKHLFSDLKNNYDEKKLLSFLLL